MIRLEVENQPHPKKRTENIGKKKSQVRENLFRKYL